MIWNNGQLPADWTIEHLLSAHASMSFHPDIANTFFRAGMIEAWGRGIEKMRTVCETEGVPSPVLRVEAIGMWVEFVNHGITLEAAEITRIIKSQTESQTESLEVRVLHLLEGGSKSKSELSKGLGQKKVSGQLNKVVRLLLVGEAIEFTIPGKPRSRLQKYRLTKKGEAILEELGYEFE